MIRESDFILNFNSEKYIGESPTKLKVSIDAVNENRLLKSPSFISHNETDKRRIKIHNLWSELAELENNIWNYGWSEIDSFRSRDEDEYYDVYKIPIGAQREFFRKLFFINLFKILLVLDEDFDEGFFNSFLKNGTASIPLMDIDYKLTIFIEECIWEEKEQKTRSDKRENIFKLIRSTEIDLNTEYKKSIFNDLVNACKAITGNRLFFHYEFNHNYSSGQQNLLNFYSRFYWAKNDLIDIETGEYEFFRKKLVIFIDEGEVALHPEWQRRFFNQSINFLSELFEGREIQLILTTHSPFVLSDIPKRNILFLDRDTNSGKTKLVDMEKENTFGANIYALLTDSFFMENTIGEFSYEKMKSVLDTLSNDKVDINEERKAEFRFIIDNIGEPLIKEQLEYLYNLKFGSDEVRELKRRIIELENQLNNKEDDNIKN